VGDPKEDITRFYRYGSFLLTVFNLGFVALYLYKLGYQPRDIAPLLVYIFIPAFFGDVVRFVWPAFNRLWTRVMGPLMRDREKQQWNGVIFYLLGAWIVLSFFPKV
jgi:diacylglycerol kinase (CTP)